ncbi:MAG: flagellar export chaperone FlgN [Desulfobacterium sp.]|nr:flagellar export chaperone FlgN [Desulfobacterium sp.]
MEKFADQIQVLLQEKLACYGHLKKLLEDDLEAILAMDVDFLWTSAKEKNKTAGQIESVRSKILDLLDDQGVVHSMDTDSFRLSTLGSCVLGKVVRVGVEAMVIAINTRKDEIQALAQANNRYISEHQKVIGDVISTIVKVNDLDHYGGSGRISEKKESNHFIRARV